jgi:hypothetical protein
MADSEISPESLSWTVFFLTTAGALAFVAAVVVFILM